MSLKNIINVIYISEIQIGTWCVFVNLGVMILCQGLCTSPINTKYLYNICTMWAQRLRRWSNIAQMFYVYWVTSGWQLGSETWPLFKQSCKCHNG